MPVFRGNLRRLDSTSRPRLLLRAPEIRGTRLRNFGARLSRGHPWIYSSEVGNRQDLQALSPCLCTVVDGQREVGIALYNKFAFIAGRMISWQAYEVVSSEFLALRMQEAWDLRKLWSMARFARLIHEEGDFLPGLRVDAFGPTLVVGLTTRVTGLVLKESLVALCRQVFHPQTLVVANDIYERWYEKLPYLPERECQKEEVHQVLEEDGFSYMVDLLHGPLWQFKLRGAREWIRHHAKGQSVLEVNPRFPGSWGIPALLGGARHLVCWTSFRYHQGFHSVDRDLGLVGSGLGAPPDLMVQNLRLNGLPAADVYWTQMDSVYDSLKTRYPRETFQLVVLEWPLLTRVDQHKSRSLKFYGQWVRGVVPHLVAGGHLLVVNHDRHLSLSQVYQVIGQACSEVGREASILEDHQEAWDHPCPLELRASQTCRVFKVRLT